MKNRNEEKSQSYDIWFQALDTRFHDDMTVLVRSSGRCCRAARNCCCAVVASAALTAKQQVQYLVRPVAQSLQPHGLRLLVEEGLGVDGAVQLPGQSARPRLFLALAAVPL